jgi:hypothetical protein
MERWDGYKWDRQRRKKRWVDVLRLYGPAQGECGQGGEWDMLQGLPINDKVMWMRRDSQDSVTFLWGG